MDFSGIHNVKTDMKSQILTVDGTIEPEKLTSFLRGKVHKHAEIVADKKEEKKVQIIKEEIKKEKKKLAVSDEGKSSDSSTKNVEVKEEIKAVEVKAKEGNAPYFIHFVYAPQLFSDENPNACSIS